ncbi:MAG: ATP12 family protein [Paracoccaceae bacterium]
MSGWARKRFWKDVAVSEVDDGYGILLDGRTVKTPAKVPLVVPTRALADMIATEWAGVGDTIDPEAMPVTRAANAAIDKVRGQFSEVAQMLSAYGETDLLCYRADKPAELVARQAAAWDPVLAWSESRFGIRWHTASGVMPRPQPPETLRVLGGHVASFSDFELTGFHDLVAMSGSLVIGLAVSEGHQSPETLWEISRIDEDWQIEHWGSDDEAEIHAAMRRAAFLQAAAFLAASRTGKAQS